MLPASSRTVSTSSTNPISGYPTYGVPAIPPFSVNVPNVNSHANHQPGGGVAQLSSLHQGTDPNSPELFKEHLALAQDQVIRVQSLAREVLSSIQNAYNPNTSPKHTSECIESLKQCIQNLYDTLRHTGIGALPLPPPNATGIPNEQQLLAEASRSVQVLYETLKRSQDSAAVVANLLGGDAQRSTK